MSCRAAAAFGRTVPLAAGLPAGPTSLGRDRPWTVFTGGAP